MPIRPARVTPHTLENVVLSAPFALLRIGRSARMELHRGVAEFFDRAYPRQFAFGTVWRGDVRDAGWFDRVFQTSQGAVRGGVGDGYYLLQGEWVVGHHNGEVRPHRYIGEHGAEALRERVRRLAFPLGVAEADFDVACQIVGYFDEIVVRRQRASGGGARDTYVHDDRAPGASPPPGGRTSPPPGSRARPPRPPPPAADDPFAVLQIARDATDQEIKAAFRAQMKMNHPDKVAHMSPALQQFAHDQVLAIKAAYERILALRRGG